MATSLPEMKFRRSITDSALGEHWMMTWHEDREISPGVPDLHYVMKGAPGEQFRVGWLELKALDVNVTNTQRVKIEPSQHQYLRRWTPHMPIHFMVRVKDRVFVIPALWARELVQATCLADMAALCSIQFDLVDMAKALPPFLREVTKV
jgi:hypothetical protein